MTGVSALFSALFGVGVIVIGIKSKRFTAGYRISSGRPVPRWQGLSLFLVVGGLFTVFGVIDLVRALLDR